MRVLALDTTTRAGSVAIVDDETVVDERRGDEARTHAERLPSEILSLIAGNQMTLSSVDLFAVASGPGSFTGLRIGIATMQGFAFVQRRPMAGVSALAALAHSASRDLPPGVRVAAWMNAYRGDVFAALYEVGGAPPFDSTRLVEVEEPSVGSPASTWARWSTRFGSPSMVVGDGAELYRELIAPARIVNAPLIAGTIGRLAVDYARRGAAVHPSGLQPLYVRRPDAEVARDRR